MAVFRCKLSRKDQTQRLIVSCDVIGEEHGYETREREFDNESQAATALSQAGIRFDPIPKDAGPGWSRSFEISHNEAQKLDVLHVDSTE
ncbi:hypothetical protein [Edaphobacter bradus]|uniref:hypothetical protein n=1 Tax=Edaphobacter bradus TaxID=2259016 RepID=UPI0021DF5B77|nr:hypothetical protein [Edaphobacter bradus]